MANRTVVKVFPAPEILSNQEPHTHNVYAAPVKHNGVFHLWFDCYETGEQLYLKPFQQFMAFEDMHDFYMQNYMNYTLTFSNWWKRMSKFNIRFRSDDVVYNSLDDGIYRVTNVSRQRCFIHALHRDRFDLVEAVKIDMDRVKENGTVNADMANPIQLNHTKLEHIGKSSLRDIAFRILGKQRFIEAKDCIYLQLISKTKGALNLNKGPSIVSKYFKCKSINFIRFVVTQADKNEIPHPKSRNVYTLKMRKSKFDSAFNNNGYVFTEKQNDIEIGFFDYITLRYSCSSDTFRFNCVFMKQELDENGAAYGEILGEDLVTSRLLFWNKY
eukprot:181482_1